MSGGQDNTDTVSGLMAYAIKKDASKVDGFLTDKLKQHKTTLPNAVTGHIDNQIDHPDHYNQGTIETIDFIEDRDHLGFNRQNAIKYIDRSGMKSGENKETSLKKAIWYLERELGMHRKGEL